MDDNNHHPYRVLNDEEEVKVLMKSVEISDRMRTFSGRRSIPRSASRSHPNHQAKSPPRFGIASHAMKIEKVNLLIVSFFILTKVLSKQRRWDRALKATLNAEPTTQKNQVDQDSQRLINTLVSNSTSVPSLGELYPSNAVDATQTKRATTSSVIEETAAIVCSKYEENLRVVEKLFMEKKAMEKRMQLLEMKLERRDTIERHDVEAEEVPPPRYGKLMPIVYLLIYILYIT
jgi:hypothetical protein